MKYLKLFEEFDESKPKSITIEMNDNFIKEKELYKYNQNIEMQSDLYYNLGNTKYEINKPTEFFFASYLPDINEIQYFTFETSTPEKFKELSNYTSINKVQLNRLIETSKDRSQGLRYIPGSYFKFNSLEVGEVSDRGEYFKVVGVK